MGVGATLPTTLIRGMDIRSLGALSSAVPDWTSLTVYSMFQTRTLILTTTNQGPLCDPESCTSYATRLGEGWVE